MQCGTYAGAVTKVRDLSLSIHLQRIAAAQGMMLAAAEALGPTAFYEDVLRVLDRLSSAKRELDFAAKDEPSITRITGEILSAAQGYFRETSIGCTEWASPSEVANFVVERAMKYCGES